MTPEALLPVALLAGLFGSGHCIGMCGPVVVLLEGPAAAAEWRYRLAYNAGRGLFYLLLGGVAGAVGLVLTRVAGIDVALRVLRFVAAALVVAIGINLLFRLQLLGFLERSGAFLWRGVSPLARRLLPIRSLPAALGAGFAWGALPCGLVYSSVALAASTASAAAGALVMLAFWLGTLPTLLAVGAAAGRVAALSQRDIPRRIAGGLMVAVGVAALALPLRAHLMHLHM